MSKIIYHTGTGTWFGADDGVYVVDIDADALAELVDTGNDENIPLDDYAATPIFDQNIEELATLFDATYYTLGTTGMEAIRIAMEDMARYFSQADEDRDDDWLQNPDGTTATFVDTVRALAVLADRFAAQGLLTVEVR